MSTPGPRHRFAHQAMNTTFEVIIAGDDVGLCQSAAQAAFRLVDQAEGCLSHFRADSDIARLNRARPGEAVNVAPETTACLTVAQRVHADSSGAFDPTVGAIVDCGRRVHWHWEAVPAAELAAARTRQGMPRIEIVEPTVVRLRADAEHGVSLDLGAIGKGFALDVIAQSLREDWDITSALLSAGGSSVLALGDEPWAVGAGGKWGVQVGRDVAWLRRGQSLSGSGYEVQGRHVIDARSGRPVTANHAAWVLAPGGALSDAWATAFLIMDHAAVEACCRREPGLGALLVTGSATKAESVVSTKAFDACTSAPGAVPALLPAH